MVRPGRRVPTVPRSSDRIHHTERLIMGYYTEVLRAAAPRGATVTVEAIAPGKVVLYVPTADGGDEQDHITVRAAQTVGVRYDAESASVASVEDGVALVRALAEHLYGNAHALGVSDTGR
jgi:hypothetical protein